MRRITILILGLFSAFAIYNGEYTLACVWWLAICATTLEKISNQLADRITEKGGAA